MEIDEQPAQALSRILEQRSGQGTPGRDAELLGLIARHAEQLRADGEPVRHEGLVLYDLDVFDLLAAERIPFEFEHHFQIELDHWFADPAPGRRSLEAFAAHPAFRDEFRLECLSLLGSHLFGAEPLASWPLDPNLLALALSVPGVAVALEAEVDAVTARAAREPERIGRLTPLLSAAGYRAFGRYLDRLAAVGAPEAEPFRNVAAIPPIPPIPVEAHDGNLGNGLDGLAFVSDFSPRFPRVEAGPTSGYALMEFLGGLATGGPLRPGRGVPGWSRIVHGLGAVALRASMATTPPGERAALTGLLLALADAGLVGGDRTIVTVVIDEEYPENLPAVVAEPIGAGMGKSGHRLIVDGHIPARAGLRLVEAAPARGWGTPDSVRRWAALLAQRGPVTRPPTGTVTGIPPATAAVLLSGAPYVSRDDAPAGYLTELGLTELPADIEELPPGRLLHLLDAAMPADPERLWESGPDTEALAAAWRTPHHVPVQFQPWA